MFNFAQLWQSATKKVNTAVISAKQVELALINANKEAQKIKVTK